MSDDTLDIFRSHLNEQFGENGVFTEEGIIDPSGENEKIIYGVFDNNTIRSNKDGANVFQKNASIRFITAESLGFDIYEKLTIYLPYRESTYTITYMDIDKEGMTVLWLA